MSALEGNNGHDAISAHDPKRTCVGPGLYLWLSGCCTRTGAPSTSVEPRSRLAATPSHVLEQRRESEKVWLAGRGLAPGESDFAFGLRRREMQEADVATLIHLA